MTDALQSQIEKVRIENERVKQEEASASAMAGMTSGKKEGRRGRPGA